MSEVKNLMDGLFDEMNRVRELITEYKSYPGGMLAASLMQISINEAEAAIKSNDVVQMLLKYTALKDWE